MNDDDYKTDTSSDEKSNIIIKKKYNTRSNKRKKEESDNSNSNTSDSSSDVSDEDTKSSDDRDETPAMPADTSAVPIAGNASEVEDIEYDNSSEIADTLQISQNDSSGILRLFIPQLNLGGKKNNKKRRRPNWAKELTEEEFKKQNDKLTKIIKYNDKPIINIIEILDSNLTFREQCEVMEKYDALNELTGYDYIEQKKEFKKEFEIYKNKLDKNIR